MKIKLAIAFSFLLVASGVAAASPFDSGSGDDSFFGNGPMFDDPFFGDNPSDDDSSDNSPFDDDWFRDDFFSDDEENTDDSDSTNETDSSEDEYGVCVIGVDSPCNSEEYDGDSDTGEDEYPENPGEDDSPDNEIEERHVTPAPEPDYVGEDYLSYPNPRDHYKHDQGIHREGSIKVCHIMMNQNGDVIRGDTVDDMTLSIDTDIPYEDAQSVTFDTPVDQVADLVGTSDDLIEGDGYLDAECAEFHDLRLDETYQYSQADISGENADEVSVVGYQEFWSNQYEPLNAVESYGSSSNSDGEITLSPGYNTRHAEVVVITQITR